MAIDDAGDVMRALRQDPFKSYNFLVTLVDTSGSPLGIVSSVLSGIQNVVLGGFTECSGLEMTLEIEERKEGGSNGTVLKFPTRMTWTNLRLKRGVTLSEDLWNWHYEFVQGNFGKRRDGISVLQSDLHVPIKVWHFRRGLPIKWTGPTFDAARGQVAVEEIEIAHEGLQLYSPGSLLGATGVSF